jgi:hypothetical protein
VISVNKEIQLHSRRRFKGKYPFFDLLRLPDNTNKAMKAYCPYADKGILEFVPAMKKTCINALDKRRKLIKIYEKVQFDEDEIGLPEFLKSVTT